MTVIVVVYWSWVAVSLAILTRRAFRRLGGHSARPTAIDVPGYTATQPNLLAMSLPRTALKPAADDGIIAHAKAALAAHAEASARISPSLPQASRSSTPGARTTLAVALAGIAMPSDLAPLAHIAGADPDRRAVFTTSGRTAEIVGVEMATELERLGFEMQTVGLLDSIARRGDEALTVRVRAIGPDPKKGPADPNYPTARAGSIVLDLELC